MNASLFIFVSIIFLFVRPTQALGLQDSPPLRVGVSKLREYFDPAFASGVGTVAILRLLHGTLVKQDSFGRITSDLAVTWKISRDSKTFQFCLPEKRFGNGHPIRIEDISFSLRRILEIEGNNSLLRGVIQDLDPRVSPIATEDTPKSDNISYCVKISLRRSYPDFMLILATPYLSIVPNRSQSTDRIGAGPYQIEYYSKEEKTLRIRNTRERSPDFFQRLEFIEMPFSSDVAKELSAGRMDMYLGADDYQKLPIQGEGYKTSYIDSLAVSHILLNATKPIFNDKAFRADLGKLFQTIVRKHTRTKVPFEFLPYLIPPGIMPRAYYNDPEFLKFNENMFVSLWQGQYSNQRLRLLGTINQFSPEIVAEIKSVLARIGINFEYISDYYGKTMELKKQGDYEMVFLGWYGVIEKPEAFIRMFESTAFDNYKSKKILKTELDELMNILSETEAEPENKMSQLISVLAKIDDEHILIPIFRTRNAIIHRDSIKLSSSKFRYYFDLAKVQRRANP